MNNLQIGFARVNVTPMMGIGMSGYYSERKADGVLDNLELLALAVSDGTNKALLVSLDNLGIKRDCILAYKKHITEVTGVPADAIYIHATHIHTGPSLEKDSGDILMDEYYQFLYRKMADVCAFALEDLKPAKMGIGVTQAPEISFIRRFLMKDGTTQTNPGINNPDIVSPIGEPDHRVNLLRFDREGGDHVLLVNYGTHPDVVGGCKFSADWPGHLRRQLERAIPDCKCIFFNGAQGDVNHINVHPDPDMPATLVKYAYSQYMGRVLAGTVMQIYDRVKYMDVPSIRFKQGTIRVPANLPKPEDMPEAHRIHDIWKAGRDKELPYRGMMKVTVIAEAKRMVDYEHGPEFFELEVSAVALGNVAMVGLPGEAFTGIGTALKETPGWDLILPTCSTNGYEGYLPMEDAFGEGGYESRSSRYKPGVAEKLIEEGKKLLADLAE